MTKEKPYSPPITDVSIHKDPLAFYKRLNRRRAKNKVARKSRQEQQKAKK